MAVSRGCVEMSASALPRCGCASENELVSWIPRRIQKTTTASAAPTKNGMRQPQSESCASVSTRCSATCSSIAASCPPMSVT